MIKVLHYLGSLSAGGIPSRVMDVYRSINREIIQFDFLIGKEGKDFYDDEITRLGGHIYRIQASIRSGLKGKKELKCFFDSHKKDYDVIYIHFSSLSNIRVLLESVHSNAKVKIVHSHGNATTGNIIHDIFHKINRLRNIDKYCTHKFAVSYVAGKWMFGKHACFTVLKNPIDIKAFSYNEEIRDSVRQEMDFDGKFVVGHVGRFVEVKNHKFLIEIFAEIRKLYENVVLLLIGDGPLVNEIKQYADNHNISDYVIFLGATKEVSKFLQGVDVFVFPSICEGLGNVVIEAQAAGLKTIVSDVVPRETDITDLIEYISLTKSVSYWADRILIYKDGYKRRDTYQEISASGFELYENIKWFEEFYLTNCLKQ
ncbi:glycosyl transferase family 1 [Clostridia bacterium]|nr:glycosyl transferase family 1 [Clostridia bacterium]